MSNLEPQIKELPLGNCDGQLYIKIKPIERKGSLYTSYFVGLNSEVSKTDEIQISKTLYDALEDEFL
jgi:hypothetical protein